MDEYLFIAANVNRSIMAIMVNGEELEGLVCFTDMSGVYKIGEWFVAAQHVVMAKRINE